MEPLLLRIQETAKLLGVSKWTVYRWIDEGRLRATKIGQGSLRVFRTSVDALISETEIGRANSRGEMRSNVSKIGALKRKRQ
ncbi:MAG: helix-turn-helix domain-containing protein [Nitrospira sp.]